MRIVLQRVKRASVKVDQQVVGQIERGLLLLVGIHRNDTADAARFLSHKCAELRIFEDSDGKMNLSAKDVGGDALVVSQFTLYGDCQKGKRPSFSEAAPPNEARQMYELFVEYARQDLGRVQTGIFGASMEVELVNDGPVTFILEK